MDKRQARNKLILQITGALVAVILVMQGVEYLLSKDGTPLTKINSEPGRFSVLLPQGNVRTDSDEVPTKLGTLEYHTYRARGKFIQYIVSYIDYPQQYMDETGSGEVLKAAAAGAVSNANGTLVNEKTFMHKGQAVREISIRAGKGVRMKSRLLLVGNRMYQVMALTNARHINDKKINQVFESFDVTPAPAQPAPVPAATDSSAVSADSAVAPPPLRN